MIGNSETLQNLQLSDCHAKQTSTQYNWVLCILAKYIYIYIYIFGPNVYDFIWQKMYKRRKMNNVIFNKPKMAK